MHLKISECVISLSILFMTTERSDGLPRKSYSRKATANQNIEQNLVQPQPQPKETHSTQPMWVQKNASEYKIEPAETTFRTDKFKPGETSFEKNTKTSAPSPTPKELLVSRPAWGDDGMSRRTFAQVLMTNMSNGNDHFEEKVVQKEDTISQDGQHQPSSDNWYPEFTDQGVTESKLPPNFEVFPPWGEEGLSNTTALIDDGTNISEPVTTTKLKEECTRIDGETQYGDDYKDFRSTHSDNIETPVLELDQQNKNEVIENLDAAKVAGLRITDPLLEEAITNSVGIVDQMKKDDQQNKKGKEVKDIDPTNSPANVPNTFNIRFGSVNISDYRNIDKTSRVKCCINNQLVEKDPSLQIHPRVRKKNNEEHEEVTEKGESSFENIRSLNRSGTIDSDVFEIDLSRGKVVAPDEYGIEADDFSATSNLSDYSEIIEPNLTGGTVIYNSDPEMNELSGKTTTSEHNIVGTGKQLEEGDRCSFLEYATDKNRLLLIPNRSKEVDVLSELRAMNIINLKDFGVAYHRLYTRSRTLFLRFNTAEDARYFCNMVIGSENLEVASKCTSNDYIVRIHNIPKDTTSLQLSYAMNIAYREIPKKIEIVARKFHEGRRIRYQRMAIMHVSPSLRRRIRDCPRIHIQWIPYDIDTSVDVLRCFRCHRIGHMQNECNVPPRHSRPPPASWSYWCLDCSHYNLLPHHSGRMRRDQHHPTNADCCPTKIAYLASQVPEDHFISNGNLLQ